MSTHQERREREAFEGIARLPTNVSMIQTTSGTNNSADVQISLSNYDDGYATVRRAVSMVTCQMDFKIELQSSLVTMIGGMPMGSRGVVMSPNAHDGSSHNMRREREAFAGCARCMTRPPFLTEVPAREDRLPGGWTNRSNEKRDYTTRMSA